VEPPLILAFELIVEDHPVDACLAGFEPLRLTQVSLIHLGVVFDLAGLHQAGVERLLVLRIAVDAMRLEQVSAAVGEDDNRAAVAR
jgi:hypothetical protein